MAQECPVKTDRKASLALWHIGKAQTDISHHGFPMIASLWMKLKFHRNDDYVLDGIVEVAQRIRKTSIPIFTIG